MPLMGTNFKSGKLFDDLVNLSRKKNRFILKCFTADIFGVTCEEIDAIVTISNRKTQKRKKVNHHKSI